MYLAKVYVYFRLQLYVLFLSCRFASDYLTKGIAGLFVHVHVPSHLAMVKCGGLHFQVCCGSCTATALDGITGVVKVYVCNHVCVHSIAPYLRTSTITPLWPLKQSIKTMCSTFLVLTALLWIFDGRLWYYSFVLSAP